MQIDNNSSVAVVVKQTWANLHGVKMFLRQENQQGEIRGVDDSHILFAKVLDSNDDRGVWIKLPANQQKQDSAGEHISLLVPWSEILTIVIAQQFSPAPARRPEGSGLPVKPIRNELGPARPPTPPRGAAHRQWRVS